MQSIALILRLYKFNNYRIKHIIIISNSSLLKVNKYLGVDIFEWSSALYLSKNLSKMRLTVCTVAFAHVHRCYKSLSRKTRNSTSLISHGLKSYKRELLCICTL